MEYERQQLPDESSFSSDNPLKSLQTLTRVTNMPRMVEQFQSFDASSNINEPLLDFQLRVKELEVKNKLPDNLKDMFEVYQNKYKQVLKAKTY